MLPADIKASVREAAARAIQAGNAAVALGGIYTPQGQAAGPEGAPRARPVQGVVYRRGERPADPTPGSAARRAKERDERLGQKLAGQPMKPGPHSSAAVLFSRLALSKNSRTRALLASKDMMDLPS